MPFTAEELNLVEAIHADPKNDAPRLSYADWCKGHDLGELAEFIHLMCQEPRFDLSLKRVPPWEGQLEPGFWEIKESDPDRVARTIQLLESIYGSDRFPETQYFEFFGRGLPVCEVSTERYPDLLSQQMINAVPLARFSLFLYCDRLADWLSHPMMHRVDVLRYYPNYDWDNDEQRLITSDDLKALLTSPLIDRLTELGLCGRLGEEVGEPLQELKERVQIDFSY
jgi:uncharacterized protein (TIGR02996 family)